MLKFPKPTPIVLEKQRKKRTDQQAERICRAAVKARDHGVCRIPGCRERGELHHIIPRSRSKCLRWATANCVTICPTHHQMRHGGLITITGNADEEIIVTGETRLLAFKL